MTWFLRSVFARTIVHIAPSSLPGLVSPVALVGLASLIALSLQCAQPAAPNASSASQPHALSPPIASSSEHTTSPNVASSARSTTQQGRFLTGFSNGVRNNVPLDPPPVASLADGPVEPVISPALAKLRGAAQAKVLGKASAPSSREQLALSYAPADANYGFFADEDPSATTISSDTRSSIRPFMPIENEAALERFQRALGQLGNTRMSLKKGKKPQSLTNAAQPAKPSSPFPITSAAIPSSPTATAAPAAPASTTASSTAAASTSTTAATSTTAMPLTTSGPPLVDNKVRILAYGASHTQSDIYTGYLRSYLQSRFGNGGQGFVLVGRINNWYRTLDTVVEHKGLSRRHARYKEDVHDEPLGLFGAAFVGRFVNGYGQITLAEDSPNTQFELQYMQAPKGGTVQILVDGQLVAEVSTNGTTSEPGYFTFETTPGTHVIKLVLKGDGPVRLFGLVAETTEPGVVVDTLGIGGTRMPSMLRWDENTWIKSLQHRKPDLVTFAYGTNEAVNTAMSIPAYERNIRSVLTRMRKALPDVSCVLIAPFDFPQIQKGQPMPRPVVERIVKVQQKVAKQMGCGFWNGYAFLGGRGSMQHLSSVVPPLVSADLIHLTPLGYAYMGTAITDALMRRYDANEHYWLKQ